MTDTPDRFPHIFEVPTPPGAEGWREMYPYYLVSQDEVRDHEASVFWIQDKYHHAHPYYPFDTIAVEAWGFACGGYSTRVFAVPPVFGLDQRFVNGYLYFGAVPVTDPAQIEERARHFGERAGFYFANWDAMYEKWKEKAQVAITEMEAVTFVALPDLEPMSSVTEGLGRSRGYDALTAYSTLIDRFLLMHQYHFEMLNIGYGAYLTFFEFCKGAFPDISDQEVARMVAGLDVIAFRPDEELKKLARAAVELGVDEAFERDGTPEEIFAAMKDSDGGREWLQRFDDAKYPWFNFCSEYGFYHTQRAWIDDLAVPLRGIADYVVRARAGEDLLRPTERLRAEADAIAGKYRELFTSEDELAQFEQLLGLSRTVFPYIEDHNFYVEHWSHTIFWNKMRDLGDLLAHSGLLAARDDVFYLHRYEISEALFDVAESWAIGVAPRGSKRAQDKVARRKEIVETLRDWEAPPALGAPPEVINEPFIIMNYGVTTARVQEWLRGTTGEVRSLYGIAASPGVVEGPARVIRTEKELSQVQHGEILVSPTTAPSWASVFSRVSGVVSDAGGVMSHAAIVCREYGLPAVVGAGMATSVIETGQRIRIDGGTGTISLLDEDGGDGDRAPQTSGAAS
ncbi:PEP-utilizing enzyme [Capillimicrobium parvum]|uniref:Chondramide synthase cmdD n=1 Tax=Capillimicrobium parvum TaxID=2884022 RepID=A0A9E7BYC0_9ACTN|nr:PEP-utilizing enzyme [Capillimicrobium parvum]UGS34396.1 Chondramide synthase cmdD [Capillimicrobium parvum]